MPDSAFFSNFVLCLGSSMQDCLSPGTLAPEMVRCESVLTAVLLLHENTDHITGVHKSNQLCEKRAKAIIRTHRTLKKLLQQ